MPDRAHRIERGDLDPRLDNYDKLTELAGR
jgi:hypothetical protein